MKEYHSVVAETPELAKEIVDLVDEDVTVYSQDDSKFHLHGDDGTILTQVNIGASIDWDRILDLR